MSALADCRTRDRGGRCWPCLGIALLASFVVACQSPANVPQQILDARKPNVTLPRYIKPDDEAHAPSAPDATLLLFVHGVFGDTVETWSRRGTDSLPTLVLKRPEFATRFDAFAFGFASSTVKAGSFHIPEAAQALALEIAFRQFLTKYNRIVIVAHSMGAWSHWRCSRPSRRFVPKCRWS